VLRAFALLRVQFDTSFACLSSTQADPLAATSKSRAASSTRAACKRCMRKRCMRNFCFANVFSQIFPRCAALAPRGPTPHFWRLSAFMFSIKSSSCRRSQGPFNGVQDHESGGGGGRRGRGSATFMRAEGYNVQGKFVLQQQNENSPILFTLYCRDPSCSNARCKYMRQGLKLWPRPVDLLFVLAVPTNT